jgi:transcriptional regulator with XRE-family HTH domain
MTSLWELQAAIREEIRRRIRTGACTQLALARETGISQGYISLVLGKKKRPSLAMLDSIASAAGIHLVASIAAHPEKAGESRREPEKAKVLPIARPRPARLAA